MTNDQIAEWVGERIDKSIQENRSREILITVILVGDVFLDGALLIYGVRVGGWMPLASGIDLPVVDRLAHCQAPRNPAG